MSAAPSAAFAREGVTVSVWQLQDRHLSLKFALGSPQVRLLLCVLHATGVCSTVS
jgi:hypothetical protein